MIRLFNVLTVIFCIISPIYSQQYLNYQLRLEPVWSRVADAMGEAGSVESAEFSPNGKYIVSGTKYDHSVVMWRTSDGHELWRQYTGQEIERVGWSADGHLVAAASEDFKVTVYDALTGKVQYVLSHTNGIDGLTWSHKGAWLATGEEHTTNVDNVRQGWLHIYDMETGREIKKIDFGNTINELFFSEDDVYLLAVGHGWIKVYRTSDWSVAQTLQPGYETIFTSGVFSPDTKYVFAVGQGGTSRGNCYLWEWQTGKLIKMFNHTGKKIESVCWHPGGNYIAHAGHDPHIFVYRVDDILRFDNDAIPVAHKVWAGDHAEYLDFNVDGSFLVSAHQNGLIRLWVWMGEDPELNSRRHTWIIQEQQKEFPEK